MMFEFFSTDDARRLLLWAVGEPVFVTCLMVNALCGKIRS